MVLCRLGHQLDPYRTASPNAFQRRSNRGVDILPRPVGAGLLGRPERLVGHAIEVWRYGCSSHCLTLSNAKLRLCFLLSSRAVVLADPISTGVGWRTRGSPCKTECIAVCQTSFDEHPNQPVNGSWSAIGPPRATGRSCGWCTPSAINACSGIVFLYYCTICGCIPPFVYAHRVV